MGERNRLGFLQMCESRHIGFHIVGHQGKQFCKKLFQLPVDLVNLIPHIQLHVQSHLVVAASSCMKFLPGISDPVDQVRLYEAVDIFVL